MANFSRRNILKGGAGVAAGAAAISFGQLFQYTRVFGQSEGDDPQLILNLADTAETFACVHYYNAIMSADALHLSADEVRNLKAFLDSELKHKQFLEANGAEALATEFYVPANLYSDRNTFITTSDTAENWFVAAYLSAVRRFAELGNPLLAATAAQVMGIEAEHQALIRQMGGLLPSNHTLKQALFYNTSEVVPFFQPFLDGSGEGFVGPAPFPGAGEIAELVGDEGVLADVPFIQLTNGMGLIGMAAMTQEPSMVTGVCAVAGSNTIVRSAPSTSSERAGALTQGQTANVIGQTTDASGITWYQIEGGWVRSDVVTIDGDCSAVPQVNA
ncbi:MAG: ferritin-like domain-containing protein [Chloroflexota bacterium]